MRGAVACAARAIVRCCCCVDVTALMCTGPAVLFVVDSVAVASAFVLTSMNAASVARAEIGDVADIEVTVLASLTGAAAASAARRDMHSLIAAAAAAAAPRARSLAAAGAAAAAGSTALREPIHVFNDDLSESEGGASGGGSAEIIDDPSDRAPHAQHAAATVAEGGSDAVSESSWRHGSPLTARASVGDRIMVAYRCAPRRDVRVRVRRLPGARARHR